MADQFSALELLLDPGEQYDDPVRRKALAATLRKQNAYGTLGQLMGVDPTVRAGTAIQEQSQGSLKMALAKQQAAKEAEARAAERRQAELWQQQNFAQRERGIEATRINQAATRAGSGPIIDTPGGKVRVTPENTVAPILDASGNQVPRDPIKPSETQAKAATFASQFEVNLPTMLELLDGGYIPDVKDTVLGTNPSTDLLSRGATAVGMSDKGKLYYAAAKPLVNAVMRRESGAAISESEWAQAFARWLPAAGDTPDVIALKRKALDQQLENLRKEAGSAYTPLAPAEKPAAAQKPVYKYDRQGNLIGGP